MAFQETPLAKVGVFGDDRETVLGRVCPNRQIRSLAESGLPDMYSAGETVCQTLA